MGAFKRLLSNKAAALGIFLITLLFLMIAIGPLLAPYNPYEQDFASSMNGPSWQHPLGTDTVGRDLLSSLIYGSRISLGMSFSGVALGSLVGIVLGLTAGYYEGVYGAVVMRLMDVIYSFPSIILAIILMSFVGKGAGMVGLTVAIYTVPIIARTTRGSVLNVKQQAYVEASHAAGSSDFNIIRRHIFINVMLPIVVLATLRLGTALLIASSLGFLGLGVQPPAPEWGAMLSKGRDFLWLAPHVVIFPGIAIAISVLAFNLVGDGMRDVVDPKTRYS